jgi:quercetin dioxygenase-like cupin family protein
MTEVYMTTLKQGLFAVLMVFLWISAAAAADEKGGPAAPTGPTVVHMAKYPIAVGKGEFELLTIIMDFPAGAGVTNHKHGGHVLVTVLSGDMTLREKGGERVVKTGESWTERPGDVHAVINAGTDTARVAVSILLPKGAEVTTMMK